MSNLKNNSKWIKGQDDPQPHQPTPSLLSDEVTKDNNASHIENDSKEFIFRPSYSAIPLKEIVCILDRHGNGKIKSDFRNVLDDMSSWIYRKNIQTLDSLVDYIVESLMSNVSLHDIIMNLALLDGAEMLQKGSPSYEWQDAPISIVYDNTVQYLIDAAMDVDNKTPTIPFYALRELIRLIWLVKNRPDRMDLPMYNVTDDDSNNSAKVDDSIGDEDDLIMTNTQTEDNK